MIVLAQFESNTQSGRGKSAATLAERVQQGEQRNKIEKAETEREEEKEKDRGNERREEERRGEGRGGEERRGKRRGEEREQAAGDETSTKEPSGSVRGLINVFAYLFSADCKQEVSVH